MTDLNSVNYETLISIEQLKALLGRSNLVLFDCRFNLMDPKEGHESYLRDHISGAIYANLDQHLSSPIGPETGRHPLPDAQELSDWLGSAGVNNDTQVVVYDDQSGLYASRLWWLMRWLGHDKVAVLREGYSQAKSSGLAIDKRIPTPESQVFSRAASLETAISTEVLQQHLSDKQKKLVDVRTAERFRGEKEPIDPVAGHIPGALNIPQSMFLDTNGRFREPEEIEAVVNRVVGEFNNDQIILMCGSGVTACQIRLALATTRLPKAAIYPGSWSEWIRDADRPIAKQ